MREIENREDVNELVVTFYDKIRKDEVLGPIFNFHLDGKWPAHLEKLTDFWETNLFRVPKFKGNPPQAHIKVDKAANNEITQKHFGRWLQMWFETIEEIGFEGEIAQRAKDSARRMSTNLFMAIWNNRPGNIAI